MTSRTSVRFLDRSTPPTIVTLILLASLQAASLNVFLPSLPAMTAHFQTDYRIMQLSVSLYLAMSAVLQIVIGPISDKVGRRPVLLWGVSLFCLATLGCIFAPNAEVFLAMRMLQAVVVAGMVLSRAIVRDMVGPDEAASMIGYVTMGMAVVPMASPALGGLLDQLFGWQASFWVLFVAGLALFWLIHKDLGETNRSQGRTLAEQMREYPELLTSRRFWGYCLAAAFASGAFFAYLGGAPFVGVDTFGLSPAALGIFFGAPAVGYLIGNGISGRFAVRMGLNWMILTGGLLNLAGMCLLLILFRMGLGSEWVFFGLTTFIGLGNGMVLPSATSGMLSVRPSLAGSASGLGGAIMVGGGALLAALAASVLKPGAGAEPLIWIMLLSVAAGVAAMLYTIQRERQMAGR